MRVESQVWRFGEVGSADSEKWHVGAKGEIRYQHRQVAVIFAVGADQLEKNEIHA